MKIALVHLEIAFLPCLSVVTWSSLMISKVCTNLEHAIKNVEVFVKKVTDMKEARVDEVFESIAETILLKVDNYPKSPEQFSADNIAFTNTIAIDLEVKSSAAEKTVVTIINKFMELITDPNVEEVKYNWMDLEKIHKVGSESKLIEGPYEPGSLDKIILSLHFLSLQN